MEIEFIECYRVAVICININQHNNINQHINVTNIIIEIHE